MFGRRKEATISRAGTYVVWSTRRDTAVSRLPDKQESSAVVLLDSE